MVLSLSVPVSVRSLPKEIEVVPELARAWAESLPLTQPDIAAKALLDTVAALNRGKLSAEDRVALLDVYRPTRDTLLDALESVCAYASVPLDAEAEQAFQLTRQLLIEFGYGYKMYILEKTGKFIVFNARKSLPWPVYRALSDQRRLMLQTYKTYHPIHPGFWQEAHALLSYAEERGFADESVESPGEVSIRDLHTELMMLALADPYRLMHGEVDAVAHTLRAHVKEVHVAKLDDDNPPSRLARPIVVALDSDSPPRAVTPGVKTPIGEAMRRIDTSGITSILREQVQVTRHANAAVSRARHDSNDLAIRLVRMWSDPPRRLSVRNGIVTNVAVCSGIETVAYFSELAQGEPVAAAPALIDGVPTPRMPQDPVSQLAGVEPWGVLNQSAHGLRLIRTQRGNVRVTVGDVVGVRFVHARAWSVGAVRWLTVLDDEEIEFGLELLAPAAARVTTRLTPNMPCTALLLATSAALPQRTSAKSTDARQNDDTSGVSDILLTESGTFEQDRQFEIMDRGETYAVRASMLIESTPRFDMFVFTPA
jgi:cyclic-di-GMP-binding protein